ncbi:hypothetical protein CPB84DRAFT_1853124 [Gymnopilus junonius]|uniref:Uncharacterized protein n=1 Tax=Gymnopilus junonius TaxID=109634 RepID=A0A9P5NAG6_GYMJU|nr:hypothetical protein CPB84DRAFT_1853124 [Gymnopilus junonius]
MAPPPFPICPLCTHSADRPSFQSTGSPRIFLRSMCYFLHSQSMPKGTKKRNTLQVEVEPIPCSAGFDFEALLKEADAGEQCMFLEGEVSLEEGHPGMLGAEAEEKERVKGNLGIREGNGGREDETLKHSHASAFPLKGGISCSHQRHHLKRNECIAVEGHAPNLEALTSILQASTPLLMNLKTPELPATTCGSQAWHYFPKADDLKPQIIEELMANEGYQLIHSNPLIPHPILDADQNVIGAFCSHPNDSDYLAACSRVYQLFEEIGKSSNLKDNAFANCRGPFLVLNVGITHGKGTTHPMSLHVSKDDKPSKYEDLATAALCDPDLN